MRDSHQCLQTAQHLSQGKTCLTWSSDTARESLAYSHVPPISTDGWCNSQPRHMVSFPLSWSKILLPDSRRISLSQNTSIMPACKRVTHASLLVLCHFNLRLAHRHTLDHSNTASNGSLGLSEIPYKPRSTNTNAVVIHDISICTFPEATTCETERRGTNRWRSGPDLISTTLPCLPDVLASNRRRSCTTLAHSPRTSGSPVGFPH